MQNKCKGEVLVDEYNTLMKKYKESTIEYEKEKYLQLANKKKHELLLIDEYRALLKKARESESDSEKEKYSQLAHEKHQEILMEQFGGDKNIGRFNKW